MAILLASSGTVGITATSTTLDVALPAGIVENDICLWHTHTQKSTLSHAYPAGWTVVGPVLNLKVSALQEKAQLRWPRLRVRSPLALGVASAFLAATGFLWLAGERNERLLGALLALGLALLLVFLLFERSQKKSQPPD